MTADILMSQVVPANDKYLKTVKGLVNKFLKSKPEKIDLLSFAHYCVEEIRPTISNSSWLSYRYQIDQCFNNEEMRKALSVKGVNPKRSNYEAAFTRAKQLNAEKLATIERYCATSPSLYATPLQLCLRATLLTGLRPNEWLRCQLESLDEIKFLRVSNTVKGESEGHKLTERRIPLTHLNDEQMSELVDWLVLCESNDYERLISGVKAFLKQICQREFAHDRKRIQLYSARHQFAANLKATGLEKSLIAKLLGHATEEMQTQHYGRTLHGHALPFDSALAERLNSL
ncbi:tyrosine-type recombinase/integrase [Idiomarina abyssalis]|uniref:Tyrosine-type recombinase/integrase n=1 Tax=Idiomarina abyssalis TaxID=86102 RepID=A0A8I1GD53_9GAMM|nr:tyrosine-type recombinase/integrase [Idiomarina abyssalis]MBJ7265579.1 tyrosine-type recombinase/integrase [Idiomarina abyssalis]MBJ7316747.1 tyrosine-type recombinase/integrase [Idiomarina abyssalis]